MCDSNDLNNLWSQLMQELSYDAMFDINRWLAT